MFQRLSKNAPEGPEREAHTRTQPQNQKGVAMRDRPGESQLTLYVNSPEILWGPERTAANVNTKEEIWQQIRLKRGDPNQADL